MALGASNIVGGLVGSRFCVILGVQEGCTFLLAANAENFGSFKKITVSIANDATAFSICSICARAPAGDSASHNGGTILTARVVIIILFVVFFLATEGVALQFTLSVVHSLFDFGCHADSICDYVVQYTTEAFAWGHDAT
jgi:hypothetical protein